MFGVMHFHLKRLNERIEEKKLHVKDNEGLRDTIVIEEYND